nr:reverse transcriptase domain-containing protein [Tanacetum cinerariifolium]
MRTRSSSNLPGESSPNPTSLNLKHRNCRRSKQPFSLEESPVDTMDDQRTMAELLRAPTEGYVETIVFPLILAEQFKLKYILINMMTSDQFFGLEKDNPHDHIRPSVPMPPLFINPKQDERVEETLMDPKLGEFTIKVPPKNLNLLLKETMWCIKGIIFTPISLILQGCTSKSKVKDDMFDPEGDVNLDSTKYLPPYNINPLSGSTTSSSLNHLVEEFADELALITFPPGNDDLPFDIESDLKEIRYFLNYDPTKDMDSILKDSIDESNLADLIDNLVDTMPEMFTDKHALDYSSMPLYDEFESYNDDAYNDPFDSKGEKIKESKLLIDKLDLRRSSDFLPFPKYDLFLFEDFSEVDALPSTNNEDKKFPVLKLYSRFHPKIRKKVFKPRILTSKGVHTSLLLEISDWGPKAFKVIKILESPMEIFPCSFGEDIRILDV